VPTGDRVISKKELEALSRNFSRQIKAVRQHAVGGYTAFLDLEDTPDSFSGQSGKSLIVDSSEKILGFKSFAFLDLGDTPASFAGEADKVLKVNAGEDAVEFGTLGDFPLDILGTPTYKTLQDWLNLTQSAGKTIVGAVLTAHSPANGTLDIAAGTGFIKTTDSPVGDTKFFDWSAVSEQALDDGTTSYIYIDYNAGSPIPKVTTTRANIEWNRHFTLGRAYRSGNTVHVINSGVDLTNTNRRNYERLIGVRGFERDSGGVISESGERYLESTAGIFWLGANEIATAAQNTNNGDRFTKWYPVGGVWNSATEQQQVDNTQYSDGTDLQNLTPNKYGCMWCYIDYGSHLHVVYGLQNGTLTTARAADPPDVSAFIRDFAILAARIIVQQGTANIIEFKSAYVTFFPHTTPSEHNDMGSLQGGTANEYYHFTNAEHTELAVIVDLGRGIADNNLLAVDQAAGLTDGEIIRATASGLEGRNYSEIIADLDLNPVLGVEWNQGTDTWRNIDKNGNTIVLTSSNFDNHPVWGNMVRVNMAVDGTINAVKGGMGTFTNDGTNGRVMVRIPKFWVKSASSSANVYRWWISPTPMAGFTLYPAFKQSDGGAGAERDFIYIAAYEADPYYDDVNLVLHSRTGKQPFTGGQIWKVNFDGGQNEPAIGDDVGTATDDNFFIVDYIVTGGTWAGNDASGKLWIRKPGDDTCGWTDNEQINNNTQANVLANGGAGLGVNGATTALGFNLSQARDYAQNIGADWQIWNVWEMFAIRLLYYIEYMGANSQTAIGQGVVSKAGGTGFAGELTGADNIDTNVGANGTGTGDGVDGVTPIAYRGIENLWGNVWKWTEGWNAVSGVDAANDVKYRVLKKDGTTTFADTLATYDESPNYVHTALPNGYQKNIEWNDGFELLFLPSAVTGLSTSHLYDYFYEHDNGETNVLFFGGAWASGVNAGVGCLYSSDGAAYSSRALGGRLSFIK